MMNLFATQAEHVHNTIYSDRLTGGTDIMVYDKMAES